MDGLFCDHGNLAASCHICKGGKNEDGSVKTGVTKQLEDERCDLCDHYPCKRETDQKTWRCPVCNYRSHIDGSGASSFDFSKMDDTTGTKGGRSDLQKSVNRFRNNFWHQIPRERRNEILNNTDDLSGPYYSRMAPFFNFEMTPEKRQKKREEALREAKEAEERIAAQRRAAEKQQREMEEQIRAAKEAAEAKRAEGVRQAIESSDFPKLLAYHAEGDASVDSTIVRVLTELRVDRNLRKLRRVSEYISEKSVHKRLGGEVLGEFLRTLLKYYPKELEYARDGLSFWAGPKGGDTLGKVMGELDQGSILKLLSQQDRWFEWWGEGTIVSFTDLIISNTEGEGDYLLLAKELNLGSLEGDRSLSYIIRRNNYISGKDDNESSIMLKEIGDDECRIMALLTTGPRSFSKLCSAADFSRIVSSSFFSLILSVDQAGLFLKVQEGGKSTIEIENRINDLSNLGGAYSASIVSKLKRVLGMENKHEGAYFTLEKQRFIPSISGSKSLKIVVGEDPFRLAKNVIDRDLSFSKGGRSQLDSLLESHK